MSNTEYSVQLAMIYTCPTLLGQLYMQACVGGKSADTNGSCADIIQPRNYWALGSPGFPL